MLVCTFRCGKGLTTVLTAVKKNKQPAHTPGGPGRLRSWSGPVETDFQGRLRFSYANRPAPRVLSSYVSLFHRRWLSPRARTLLACHPLSLATLDSTVLNLCACESPFRILFFPLLPDSPTRKLSAPASVSLLPQNLASCASTCPGEEGRRRHR
jgi:hypothetical protein